MKRWVEDFERPHIIRRQRLKICTFKRTAVIFIIVLLLLAAAVVSWFFLFSPFSVKLNKADYYLLSLATANTLKDAETLSEDIAAAGGGGYIINDGQLKIAVAVYKKAADADTVMERYKEAFPTSSVTDVSIKKSKIRRPDRASSKEIKKILEYPMELADLVLAENLKLDTFENSESAALLALKDQEEKMSGHKKSLENLLNDYPTNEELNKAHEFYLSMIESWEQAVSLTGGQSLTHRLKYFACKTVCLYSDLRQKL